MSASVQDPIVAKRAAPLLRQIRDLCLRRGDGGIRDLCRVFRKERIGPEEFNAEMFGFGISLTAQESDAVFQAFRDPIGYLLVTPFLEGLLHVIPPQATLAIEAAFASLGPVTLPVTAAQRKAGFTRPRHVVLRSAIVNGANGSADPTVAAGIRSTDAAHKEFLDVFDCRYYPEDLVAETEFRAYYAAIAVAVQGVLSEDALALSIRQQWGVNSEAIAAEDADTEGRAAGLYSTQNGSTGDAAGNASLALTQTIVSTALPHKSKFVEVRDKIDVPSRVVGYQGHLPTSQDRFGETFHRIECSVGSLRKIHPDDIPETGAATFKDYTKAFVRQGNKANTHNFRFA